MRHHYLLLFLAATLVLPATGQTTHVVTVSDFAFTPAELVIVNGDSVIWQNTEGFHNVEETTASSPAGFGNEAGTGWTYGFQFNDVGAFSYICGVHPAMTGSITVNPGASTEEVPEEGFLLRPTGPNPLVDGTSFVLTLRDAQDVRATVHDALGREVDVLHNGPVAAGRALNLVWRPSAHLADATYLVRVQGASLNATRSVTLTRRTPHEHH